VFLADLVHSYTSGTRGGYASGNESGFVVPYGIASIAAYTKNIFGDAVDISLFKFPNDLLAACKAAMPDVIAFSNYMWNNNLNFTLGTKLREQFPNALIVVGGPSVRTDAKGIEEYLRRNSFVDICVLHEGERPFAEILAAYKETGKAFIAQSHPIKSSGYISNGRLIYKENDKSEELDEFPSPYLEGYLDDFIARGLAPLFETNRGCPFHCTYCAWGVAALNKVRKFPMEKILAELDYVSQKFPSCPGWIIGDANFGILQRDVEIARRIRQICDKNQALQSIVVYESKNTPARNIQIAKLLRNADGGEGHQSDNTLIALQTLDTVAQEATKRSNIKLGDVPKNVEIYHADGHGVRTDILSGLPGETRDGHLETLRKVFTYGFDHIGIYNVLLLPGTEMECQSSRETHRILTKFRTRDGAFGDYQGIKSVEAEEVICGNSAITPNDLLTLRLIHWAIWYGWNHGFLKPVLRYALDISKKNPADVLHQLVTGETSVNKSMREFFTHLRDEYSSEFFDSAESLRNHYLSGSGWAALTTRKQRRVGFIYNARLINDRSLFNCMLEALRDIVTAGSDPAHYDELCRLLMQMRIEPNAIHVGDLETRISASIPSDIMGCFVPGTTEPPGERCHFILQKTAEEQEKIRESLKKNAYADSPLLAISHTIEAIPSAFAYDFVDIKAQR